MVQTVAEECERELRAQCGGKQELQQLFTSFDEDNSGTLNMDEIYAMFKSVGIVIPMA